MSASMRIERVTALPGTLTASTMYIVKSAEAGFAEVYFSNNDGSEARHIINKSEINNMVTDAVTAFSNMEVVADITARDAISLTRNALVLVLDASGDVSVAAGAATYVYDLANTAWVKISEFESLDVTLQWTNIQGRPTSSSAAIDDAVAKAHVHANKAQIDLIGEDVTGKLTYNGANIEANVAVAAW